MKTCPDFQYLLLDKLYGLLEPADDRQLTEHLGQCAACRSALAESEKLQGLLGLAAKTEFPAVRFDAPAAVAQPSPAPAPPTVAVAPKARRRPWLPLTVAASVVVFLSAGGLLALLIGNGLTPRWQMAANEKGDYDRAQAALAKKQQELEQARKDYNAIQKRNEELAGEEQDKLDQAARTARDKQFYMVITGPETVQPGAPNEFQIETRNFNKNPVPARLVARVKDQSEQVVYEQDILSQGTYRLALPLDLQMRVSSDLYLEVEARGGGGPKGKLTEKLKLAASRYVTHLTTDKPLYRPGEVVYFRSLTLDRFSMKPPSEDLRITFTVIKPNGEKVVVGSGSAQVLNEKRESLLGPDKQPIKGVGPGAFVLPADGAGGEYTLTVEESQNRFPPEQRKFLVQDYQTHRLAKVLEWDRKSYGPGDAVLAVCKLTRTEGGRPLANLPVKATVQVDGQQYDEAGKPSDRPILFTTDSQGGVNVRFQLPRQIAKGEAVLALQFGDGANVETLAKPIPIVLRRLEVEFFPEGGDLIAGAPNRVYFQVRSTLDRAADLKGRIVDEEGRVVTEAVTLTDAQHPGVNQGLGLFELTPKAGAKYELLIDSPAGIEGKHFLPEVKAEGVVLSIPTGVTTDRDVIRIVVHSAGSDRRLLIGAYCRGRLLDHERVLLAKGQTREVPLKPEAGTGGVYRITVFEELPSADNRQHLKPVAERLVYRAPANQLNLSVKADKARYVPGDKVTLSLTAQNEKGEAAPAILLVAVVDKSVLTMADEKTARGMPTHFFLTNEVRKPEELEHADFLLTDHPQAKTALDLLLGTQGWRRFAEQNPKEFQEKLAREADRLLVSIGQMSPKSMNSIRQDLQKVHKEYEPRFQEVNEELAASVDNLVVLEDQETKLKAEQAAEWQAYLTADRALDAYLQTLRYWVAGIGTGALLALALVTFVVGLLRSLPRGLPYFATGACSLLLCALVVALSLQTSSPGGKQSVLLYERSPATNKAGRAPDDRMLRDATELEKADKDRPGKAAEVMPPMQPAPGPGGFAPKEEGVAKGPDGKRGSGKDDNNQDGPFGGKAGQRLQKKGTGKGEGGEAKKDADSKLMDDIKLRADGFHMDMPLPDQAVVKAKEAAVRRAMMAPGGPTRTKAPTGDKDAGRDRRDPVLAELEMSFLRTTAPVPPPFVVREYAHKRTHTDSTVRVDWTETLCWQPVLVLPNGKGEVHFELGDSITSYQVLAYGHTLNGSIGAVTNVVESRKPFSVDVKLPLEVTATDKVIAPLAIANDTDDRRSVSLSVARHDGLNLLDSDLQERLLLTPNQRLRRLVRFQPSLVEGTANLQLVGLSEPFAADRVERSIKVVPDGFPLVKSHSDVLEKVAHHELNLPKAWVPGTMKLQVQVYPSTLADLQKGLESLLREPHGCFEQTSTSNYPNLLILDYLKASDQANPEAAKRAREMLDRGYQKLVSFECKDPKEQAKRQGYEWFGGSAPPHEALTAYGLMQFYDMERVGAVDKEMLERTRQYLLAARDGNGGFKRNPRALDTFGRAPQHITNAYIVWSLTESGSADDLDKEIAALKETAKTSKDPYFLALVANSLINRGDEAMLPILKTLAGLQQKEGHFTGAETSITRSGGRDLHIETTALVVLAWLKANRPGDFQPNVQAAVKWIGQQRGGYGGFGSTQSTILALKALIAFTKANKKAAEAGDLRLLINGQEAGKVHFPAGAQEAIVLEVTDAEKHLKPGSNSVQVEITGKNVYPFTLAWSYRATTPESSDKCAVQLATKLNKTNAEEGETVRLTTTVENRSAKQGHGMTVAIIGLPGGLTIPEDAKQLKDYTVLRNNGTEPGVISFWEVRGRELILYWRDLAPAQKIEVNLDLICRVPGEYRGPASRAYLYYNADHKCWIDPLAVTIAAKND